MSDKIIDPGRLTQAKLVPKVEKKDIMEKAFWWGDAAFTLVFMVIEFAAGVGAFVLIFFYAVQVFVLHDHTYIGRTGKILDMLSQYWRGFIFVLVFVFFRLVLTKLTHLRNVKEGEVGSGRNIWSRGKDK